MRPRLGHTGHPARPQARADAALSRVSARPADQRAGLARLVRAHAERQRHRGLPPPRPGVVDVRARDRRVRGPRGQRLLAEPAHALRVGPVQRQPGEELRRHAPALAGVVERRTTRHAPAGLRLAQRQEQLRVPPDLLEPARRADVAGQEVLVDRERAGVDVADRVDQAHHPPGPAQVEPRQRLAVGGEVEERVAGQDAVAARDQPVVQLALLRGGRVQLVPHVRAAPGRPQPGDPQLGAELVGDRLELVELVDVLPGHHDRDLRLARSPASARFSNARIAVAYEPGPRTSSLTSAVAPSREICTST